MWCSIGGNVHTSIPISRTPRAYIFPLTARDLPIRWAELGTVYRYERSGTLHGLMRVRGFTQDDAHIFCLPEQLEDEIISVLDLTEAILSRFGFDRRDSSFVYRFVPLLMPPLLVPNAS